MSKRLIDALEDVIAAEHAAAELRRAYGSGAEKHCDALMHGRAPRDPTREHLEDIRRALKWV